MEEKEIEKLIEELYQERLSHKKSLPYHHPKPKSHGGYGSVVNFDFASLYPNIQKQYKLSPGMRKVKRRISIRKLFGESVEI